MGHKTQRQDTEGPEQHGSMRGESERDTNTEKRLGQAGYEWKLISSSVKHRKNLKSTREQ